MLRPALLLACAALTLAACDTAEAPSPDIPSDAASGVATATASEPTATEPGFTPPDGTTPSPTATAAPSPKMTPPVKATPMPDDEADACGASKVARWRSDQPSESVLAEIRRASGAQRVRVIRPGDVVTMDYSETRLNVHVGANGRIESFRCG